MIIIIMCEICKSLQSSLGVFSDKCSTFLDMMNDIGIDKKQQRHIGMGRTWQISGRICLPYGKNLSSGRISKCDPKLSSWKKLWKSQKNIKDTVLLGWGRQILENSS